MMDKIIDVEKKVNKLFKVVKVLVQKEAKDEKKKGKEVIK